MACNCSNNPCSCPGANCACPPDYVVNPATLTCTGTTCESTLQTDCIFTDNYLSCSGVPAGSTLSVALAAMDTKICQCAACSGVTYEFSENDYYVDSSVSITGDGSILNPFKTMEEARTKVIGTGSAQTPENDNITVHVLRGVGYSTTMNIYIPTTTWEFEDGAQVSYTGSGYFIDSLNFNPGSAPFTVLGYLYFVATSGGFLRNSGDYFTNVGNGNKNIYVEAKFIFGNTSNAALPLIRHNQTYGSLSESSPISTLIVMKELANRGQLTVTSAIQNTINFTGGLFSLDLNGGTLTYGFNIANGTTTGVVGGNCINYSNPGGSSYDYASSFTLKNGFITSLGNTDMISMSGTFNTFYIDNITTGNMDGANSSKPTVFLHIGTIALATGGFPTSDFSFLLRSCYLKPSGFNTTATDIITYTGVGQISYLEMQECVLYDYLSVQSTILLGLIAGGGVPVVTKNIIKGKLHMTQLPTSASGLATGDIWSNSGVLTII